MRFPVLAVLPVVAASCLQPSVDGMTIAASVGQDGTRNFDVKLDLSGAACPMLSSGATVKVAGFELHPVTRGGLRSEEAILTCVAPHFAGTAGSELTSGAQDFPVEVQDGPLAEPVRAVVTNLGTVRTASLQRSIVYPGEDAPFRWFPATDTAVVTGSIALSGGTVSVVTMARAGDSLSVRIPADALPGAATVIIDYEDTRPACAADVACVASLRGHLRVPVTVGMR